MCTHTDSTVIYKLAVMSHLIGTFSSLHFLIRIGCMCDNEAAISTLSYITYVHHIHYMRTAAADALGQCCSMG